MGLIFLETLPGPKIFKCKCCNAHSASGDAILSKDFQGRFGKAYLFNSVVNISLGPNEDRMLNSGLHTVNDIYCSCCQQMLGWRYEVVWRWKSKALSSSSSSSSSSKPCPNHVRALRGSYMNLVLPFWPNPQEKAYEPSEKYKEGKYILEKARILKEGW